VFFTGEGREVAQNSPVATTNNKIEKPQSAGLAACDAMGVGGAVLIEVVVIPTVVTEVLCSGMPPCPVNKLVAVPV
jgi:hypothetical protein